MDPAPRPYLQVESLFDRVVEMSGGERVDQLLDEPPDWDNADYVFQGREGVVVELKEIQKDLNADREFSQRIGEIHYKHRERLGVLFGRQSIRIDQLPDDIRNEMIVPFQRRVEGPVKKAAKQIKETKARLSPDSCGLLIVVNDASTFLTPDLAHFFFSRILSNQHQHSAIDHVIYCSVNMLLQSDEVPEGGCFWWDSPVAGRRELPVGLVETLCANWKRASDEAVGVSGESKQLAPDGPGVSGARFVSLPHGGPESSMFVRPKRFYKDPVLGFKYYCEHVSLGTARLFLVESYQGGELIQAEFDQKLIYATTQTYQEIEDRDEIARLKGMMKKLRRSSRASSQPQRTTPDPVGRWRIRCRAVLFGASVALVCGASVKLMGGSGVVPLYDWAVVGGLAGLLVRVLAERRRDSSPEATDRR